jgi:hypothetical protein
MDTTTRSGFIIQRWVRFGFRIGFDERFRYVFRFHFGRIYLLFVLYYFFHVTPTHVIKVDKIPAGF